MRNYDERPDASEWSRKLMGKKVLDDDVEAPANLSSDQVLNNIIFLFCFFFFLSVCFFLFLFWPDAPFQLCHH